MAVNFLEPLVQYQLGHVLANISMSSPPTDTDMYPTPFSIKTDLTNTEAAAIALDYKLYIKDHATHKHLLTTKHMGSSPCMLAVDRHGTPVGVVVVKNRLICVYVERQCRMQGVGSLLVKAMKERRSVDYRGEGMVGAPGIKGWDTFFKKNKVACLTVVK